MGTIVRSTNYVRKGEPCLELGETNEVRPIPGDGLRRIQTVLVIRNDEVWEYQRDMGAASQFKAEQFIFPGAVRVGDGRYDVVETVERLQAAADDFRSRYDRPQERPEAPLDLVGGFEETATKRHDARVGRRRFAVKGTPWLHSN